MKGICVTCGAPLVDLSRCSRCGWTDESSLQPKPKLSKSLNIASVLLFGASFATLFSILMTLYQMSDPDLYEGTGLTSQMIDVVESMLTFCIVVMAVACFMSFLTAFAVRSRKRSFSLCLVGAGIAILGVGPLYVSSVLALVALILIAISGDEFQ